MKLTHRIVCGRTRSGKLIYEMLSVPQDNNIHPEHRDFSPADHFDAYAVFSYLVVKTARELGLDAPKTERYDLQAKNHRQIISDRGLLSDLKRDAQVVTLIDLIHFAKNLVWIGYRIDD